MKSNVVVINKAIFLLKKGELVAFPTETVYGLGADASNPKAVKKIFKAKGRPADHPVIVHLYSEKQLNDWVSFIPSAAKKLIKQYWPGPLTLIFKANKNVSSIITGGQDTIGIRMPSHPVARKLLKAFGGAIAAPSANRFGRISPTKSAHVKEELGKKVSLILEGGNCKVGIESTIIDVTTTPFRLLRPGILTPEEIFKKTDIKIVISRGKAPRVSGNLASHYAPKTPVELVEFKTPEKTQSRDRQGAFAVMSFCHKPQNFNKGLWIRMPSDPTRYAKRLYATLRKLDSANVKKIFIEKPPKSPEWAAIRDRLTRAAEKEVSLPR